MSMQAQLQASLAACPDEAARVKFLMSLSTTQKAVLNFGDGYGPKPAAGLNNFTGDLLVRYIDGKTWEVAQSFTYRLGSDAGVEFVAIGAKMLTDFASMPPFVRVVFRSPGGKWDKPAVVHDCLYKVAYVSVDDGSVRHITRKEADGIFLEAMAVAGVGWLSRSLIYAGVRGGGWHAWGKHRKCDPK